MVFEEEGQNIIGGPNKIDYNNTGPLVAGGGGGGL